MKKQIRFLSKDRVFNGFFRMDELRFQHTQYQGGWTPELCRELFGRGQAAVLLLYDTNAETVALVEQCRVGALTHIQSEQDADDAWLLEPVAGMIDQGETAEQACIREAKEEAGVTLEEVEYICHYYPSPGACDEILHLYAADIDLSKAADYAGLCDDHEDIKIVQLSFAEAKQRLLNAGYNVASTYIAMQWLFFQKLPSIYS